MDTTMRYEDARAIGRRYGVRADTVLRWFRAGVVPGLRLGGRTYRFDPAAVDRALRARSAGRGAGQEASA